MMDRTVIQDLALSIMAQDSATAAPVGSWVGYYKGEGNPCQLVGMALEKTIPGLSRDERLGFLGKIFNRSIDSMKHMSVAELLAVARMESSLKEVYESVYRFN